MRKTVAILLLLLTLSLNGARAQLYNLGTDPGNVKWEQISTDNYRVIFPEGMDSLARQYAIRLEKYLVPVSTTIGYRPNQSYRNRMPVILHPFASSSNGVVTWAPRRMELLTVPDPSLSCTMPVEDHLAIHESRHVAQMQFGAARPYRWLNILSGQLWPGAMSALYPGPTFLEGDAVVAETELTESGRGRSSDFLKYYDISFADGEYRDFWKWSLGSQKHYTPDHYRAGYFLISGLRTRFNDADFTSRYYRNITTRWPFPLFVLQKTVRQASGKNLKDTFDELARNAAAEWEKAAEEREPFVPMERVTKQGRLYTVYSDLCLAGDTLFSIRSGLDRAAELVTIDPETGDVRRICPVASSAGQLTWSGTLKRLYWSENVQDPRWELKSSSVIRYLDTDGKIRNLTGRGKKYYNPYAGDNVVAVAEYPDEGGSAVVLLDAEDGHIIRRTAAPDGLQVLEFCFKDNELYFTALTSEGTGIYDSCFREVLKPGHVSISKLFISDGLIHFTSDRNGYNELYSFSPESGETRLITSSRFGACLYQLSGDRMFCISDSKDGADIYRADISDLKDEKVDFSDISAYPVADELSSQALLAAKDSRSGDGTGEPVIGKAEKYSKAAHLFRFHSWLPLYVDVDAVSSLSLETLTTGAGLGATVLFQNDLNTMQGYIGYSAWNASSGWRNSVSGKFSYKGWFPVIEATFNFNASNAIEYLPMTTYGNSGKKTSYVQTVTDLPSFKAGLHLYVPLVLSSGGWSRGIVPELNFDLSNNYFSTGRKLIPMNSIKASVRGYAMRPVPPSCIYPRFGIGAEAGISGYAGLKDYTYSQKYAFLYGYLPGILRTHGIRWTALFRSQSQNSSEINLSYAFPFAPVDWSFLSPVAYVKNFEFIGSATWSHIFSPETSDVITYRGDLAARLGNLLWIPYDTRIGTSVSYTPGISKGPEFSLLLSVSM